MNRLYEDIRPHSLDEIVGNEATVAKVRGLIENARNDGHVVALFHGPSGTGKTTMAQILANELGAPDGNDGICAFNPSGVPEARLMRSIKVLAHGGSLASYGALLFEEAQMLGPKVQALLTTLLEDEKARQNFLFCTTDLDKINPSVQTRCALLKTEPLNDAQMLTLLTRTIEKEDLPDQPQEVLDGIVRRARGSARSALVVLEVAQGLPPDEAIKAVDAVIATPEEALERYWELGEIIGMREQERFWLMMDFRLWEREGITAQKMFCRDFGKTTQTYRTWCKRDGYPLDPVKSRAGRKGAEAKHAKAETDESCQENLGTKLDQLRTAREIVEEIVANRRRIPSPELMLAECDRLIEAAESLRRRLSRRGSAA